MKILHTSDWHLGRTLYGRRRYEEFEAFLDWLAGTIESDPVDALVVAGDVFDTTAPGTRAQELYYRFLCRTAASSCRHVVVVAGNHDSPSFLDAPRELLRALDVHVIGGVPEDLEDEVLVLRDGHGNPGLVVCAVPYLHDRDVRTAEAGEQGEDKERKMIEGIRDHYARVVAAAERVRSGLGEGIPLVVTGHLFTAGGQTVDGDGVRELYVGSLAHVHAGMFPACIDYLALGHLHVPQRVNGSETMRYSGSPIPMGFGEADQRKIVCRVDFRGRTASVTPVGVPAFQRLERISGDWPGISNRMLELAAAGSRAWLEITYEGDGIPGDLRERLDEAVEGTGMEILRVRNDRIALRVLGLARASESLDDLDETEVFERCLAAHDVPGEQRTELLGTYREALAAVREQEEGGDRGDLP